MMDTSLNEIILDEHKTVKSQEYTQHDWFTKESVIFSVLKRVDDVYERISEIVLEFKVILYGCVSQLIPIMHPDHYTWICQHRMIWISAICMMCILVGGVLIMRRRMLKGRILSENIMLAICDMTKVTKEVDTVKELVKIYNVDINRLATRCGLSVFLCACLSGNHELIAYLLDRGADVHQQTMDGDTALYLCTFGVMTRKSNETDGYKAILHLIKAGCNVNTPNNKGFTPLHRAASKGDVDIIRLLLKYGADLNMKTNTGVYPSDLASSAGYFKAALMLIPKAEESPHTPHKHRLPRQITEQHPNSTRCSVIKFNNKQKRVSILL